MLLASTNFVRLSFKSFGLDDHFGKLLVDTTSHHLLSSYISILNIASPLPSNTSSHFKNFSISFPNLNPFSKDWVIFWDPFNNHVSLTEFHYLEFYTDASLIELGSTLILSLIVSPPNSTINIFTDCKSIVDTFYNRNNSFNSFRNIFKDNSSPTLWTFLLKIISFQNISLTLIKVDAHSNSNFNNKIDQLMHILENFLLNCHYLTDLILNRHSKYFNLRSDICWDFTFAYFNSEDVSSLDTSFKTSFRKAHKLKFFLELLIVQIIQRRRPDFYDNWKCPSCKIEQETFLHLWNYLTKDIVPKFLFALISKHIRSISLVSEIIFNIINFTYTSFMNQIWLMRCDKFIELEKPFNIDSIEKCKKRNL
ncbi:hypothetical protein C1645_812873 [Glomus cerebriforme]|uniref:RNase H type-1 domain-containing protein n=1 Tax=Glomus cerebriforme TaxID=658196 RepID=A0A397TPB5_9GLOM|nr:hypothetical protein C1645_812873 [Glomus cerebriforme]